MLTPYFQPPPDTLPLDRQQAWLLRIQEAETIVGITEHGMPLVSEETMALWQRYVAEEITLKQVVLLQHHRLRIR